MLVVRVEQDVVEEAPFEEILRTNGCTQAADTERAFAASGTSVERISGVGYLVRVDEENNGEGCGKPRVIDRRQGKEQTLEPEAATLVFLPAIPSWLSLWSLLSPEDAVGGSECVGEDSGKDGDGPRVGVSTAGTGRSGTGAVRLVQVVAAASISYRYSAVLQFWDAVNAASFVENFNGLALHDVIVLKAFFLSAVEIGPHRVTLHGEDGDNAHFLVGSQHRRSLSEGATLLSNPAATARQLGYEECKLTCPSEGDSNGGSNCSSDSQGQCHSRTPRRERLCSNSDLQCSGDGMGAYDGRKPASPPTPVRALSLPEKDSSGVMGLALPIHRRGGNQEQKGCEGQAGGESLSPLRDPWRSSSPRPESFKGRKEHRPRVDLAYEKRKVSLSGGGAVGTGISGEGSVLPSCPVCFDRLDPSVVGVPVASIRSQVAGSRCSHLGCVGEPNGHANGPADAMDAVGKCKGKEDGVLSSEGVVVKGEGKGVQGWQEHRGGAREGRGRPALNVVMWKGSECRVCRSLNVALEGAQDALCCETCRIAHNLWICMVCGHIGCGRYTQEHANGHFRISRHTFSLELSTGRVWDYMGDCYAHRALRGHQTQSHDRGGGCLNQGRVGREGWSPGAEGGAASGGGSCPQEGSPGLLYSEGVFEDPGQPDSVKVAVVSREYEALVARQLQEQQRYFEGLIAAAVAAEAEANAPTEEGLSKEERVELAELRREVEGLSRKHEGILESVRVAEATTRRVRSENRSLESEQRSHRREVMRIKKETLETKQWCKKHMSELEGQMQDLLFFIKAQQEVKCSPQHEELVGGSVVMGGGVDSAGGGRVVSKESEKEKLARRLKELSNARKGVKMHR